MRWELMVGLRYLRSRRREWFVSLIALIAGLGVAIGVMTLCIVLSVMTGFEEDLRDRILGFNPSIVVMNHGGLIKDAPEILDKIRSTLMPCLDVQRGHAPSGRLCIDGQSAQRMATLSGMALGSSCRSSDRMSCSRVGVLVSTVLSPSEGRCPLSRRRPSFCSCGFSPRRRRAPAS